MKKGVRVINCARGGLVDEAAIAEALKSGYVAGAAFDVFATEPGDGKPAVQPAERGCTPHLGAATFGSSGERRVQIAEQMSDYLLRGAISNAVISPRSAPRKRRA